MTTKPKLLMNRTAIRRVAVGTLRNYLDVLQEMSDKGDRRPEVYDTFVEITNELERRKSRRNAPPPTIITRTVVRKMKVQDLREKYMELLRIVEPDVETANTVRLLAKEIDRRHTHYQDTYWRRKAKQLREMEVTA